MAGFRLASGWLQAGFRLASGWLPPGESRSFGVGFFPYYGRGMLVV